MHPESEEPAAAIPGLPQAVRGPRQDSGILEQEAVWGDRLGLEGLLLGPPADTRTHVLVLSTLASPVTRGLGWAPASLRAKPLPLIPKHGSILMSPSLFWGAVREFILLTPCLWKHTWVQ